MSENSELAIFLVALVATAIDPIIIVVGALFGMAAWSWWQRIPGAVILAFALTFALSYGKDLDIGLSDWGILACRSIALIIWSAVGAAGRWVVDNIQGH